MLWSVSHWFNECKPYLARMQVDDVQEVDAEAPHISCRSQVIIYDREIKTIHGYWEFKVTTHESASDRLSGAACSIEASSPASSV